MSKQIDIDYTHIKTPVQISVDGKEYPIHQWNIKVVNEYWDSGDESVLDKLKDFSLVF
jgi:hypothetical protein